jgi:hypothetical protein
LATAEGLAKEGERGIPKTSGLRSTTSCSNPGRAKSKPLSSLTADQKLRGASGDRLSREESMEMLRRAALRHHGQELIRLRFERWFSGTPETENPGGESVRPTAGLSRHSGHAKTNPSSGKTRHSTSSGRSRLRPGTREPGFSFHDNFPAAFTL